MIVRCSSCLILYNYDVLSGYFVLILGAESTKIYMVNARRIQFTVKRFFIRSYIFSFLNLHLLSICVDLTYRPRLTIREDFIKFELLLWIWICIELWLYHCFSWVILVSLELNAGLGGLMALSPLGSVCRCVMNCTRLHHHSRWSLIILCVEIRLEVLQLAHRSRLNVFERILHLNMVYCL